MTEAQLRTRIGLFLIISHFSIILSVVVLQIFGGFLFEEMTTTVALIIPMFSIYTTAIIKNIISNKILTEKRSERVTREYIFITFMIPSVFVLFLVAIIILKSLNTVSFEQFKIMLTVSETVFGTYVGLVLASFFDIKESKNLSKTENTQVDKAA
ncbi:MAG: hypothetical protein GY795_24455 [Desulfobacterales bacterium]|nr:hypothetical protein [Desulfobacterales bacterium]